MWSAVQHKSAESRMLHLLETSCFYSSTTLDVNTSVCWEIAVASLLLGPSLICLPGFSSHCLSCSHLTHHYTSSNIPESFECECVYECVCVGALTTLHNSYCILFIEVRDCYRRFCSSFSQLQNQWLFRRATSRPGHCCY